MATDTLIVYVTFPAGKGAEVARVLVQEQLVACVNLVAPVRSIYAWQGQVHDDAEELAVMKTTAQRYAALTTRVLELHPYDVPEIIATDIDRGHPPYLDWLIAQTAPR